MKKSKNLILKLSQLLLITVTLTAYIYPQQPTPLQKPQEDNTWWYLTLFVLIAGINRGDLLEVQK
jgi:hypothetical protein